MVKKQECTHCVSRNPIRPHCGLEGFPLEQKTGKQGNPIWRNLTLQSNTCLAFKWNQEGEQN